MRTKIVAAYAAIFAAPFVTGSPLSAQQSPEEQYLKATLLAASNKCAAQTFDPKSIEARLFFDLMLKDVGITLDEYREYMKNDHLYKDAGELLNNYPGGWREFCKVLGKTRTDKLSQLALELWKDHKNRKTSGETSKDLAKTNASKQPTTDDIHKKCLQAKDYAGCVKIATSQNTSSLGRTNCKPDGRCWITVPGMDIFGMKQPLGWLYYETDDGTRVNYFSPTVYRVPHNKQEHRYLARTEIVRYYKNPKEGSSGSFIGGGSASTSCVDYGGSFSCSTTSSPSTYIPGRSATPGGVRSERFTRVVDCKDKTYASYNRIDESKTSYGWHPASESSWSMEIIDEFCSKARTLPPLKMKL